MMGLLGELNTLWAPGTLWKVTTSLQVLIPSDSVTSFVPKDSSHVIGQRILFSILLSRCRNVVVSGASGPNPSVCVTVIMLAVVCCVA
jgi:hypothetical protein